MRTSVAVGTPPVLALTVALGVPALMVATPIWTSRQIGKRNSGWRNKALQSTVVPLSVLVRGLSPVWRRGRARPQGRVWRAQSRVLGLAGLIPCPGRGP